MSTTQTLPEGALDERLVEEADGLEARRLMRAHPFQLGVLRRDAGGNGEIAAPDEVEPGHPSWFCALRDAKAAGAALLERHPDALGYDVLKVVDGHYKTVATVWKEQS